MSKESEMIKKAVAYLVKELKKDGFTVMKYEAYSSNSVYLKIDDGVVGTIRISDHYGKKHLKYRYNLIKGEKETRKVMDGDFERYFLPMRLIDVLVAKISYDRKERLAKYGEDRYKEFMKSNREEGKDKKGFWQSAKYV